MKVSNILSAQAQPLMDDTKRITKLVQPVSLAIKAASLVLFVNMPLKSVDPYLTIMYNVHLAFLCLSFFTSLGLSMYSILKSSMDRRVMKVQMCVMVMAMTFILLSFVMRSCMVLPMASLEFVWLFFFLGGGGVMLFLSIGWKRDDSNNCRASEIWEYGSSLIDLVWFIGG